MSQEHPAAPSNEADRVVRFQQRVSGGAQSMLAQAEPLVWLNGGALVLCMTMIVGLLGLIFVQGSRTFWPLPLKEVTRIDGTVVLGEVVRRERYEIGYQEAARLSSTPVQERAYKQLDPMFREKLQRLANRTELATLASRARSNVLTAIFRQLDELPAVADAPGAQRRQLQEFIRQRMNTDSVWGQAVELIRRLVEEARDDASVIHLRWHEWVAARNDWLAQPTIEDLRATLAEQDDLATQIWAAEWMDLLSVDIRTQARRRLFRTGNYELTNTHFAWVSQLEIKPGSEVEPDWAMIFERLAWGRFYGTPVALLVGDEKVAEKPEEIWQTFNELHPEVRRRWEKRRRLETVDIGEVNRLIEQQRLRLRRVELRYGKKSPEWQAASVDVQARIEKLEKEFDLIRREIERLDEENARYRLSVLTSSGQQYDLQLADIVRCYPANRLTAWEKLGVYVSRWWEFLSDSPREANSEGGVFPAIWGTVAMTLLMSVAVVPFGVLAALYLREYARSGWVVSVVRIAVNNLAGVPSIVFGVFGLGFFCYLVGGTIDQLLFTEKLPSPTFGTGGLLWASLTLALMTLPVVIVATEEALAAVPRSMREGSLACGATKWQTIRRIVLPKALPGIMTGMILAMARGAGEVAPLMLVGAVKLAPELPVDTTFPYIHLERSFMHLGFHIYDLGFQSQNSEAAKPMVLTTTLLLILLIATMNLLAMYLRSAFRRKHRETQL